MKNLPVNSSSVDKRDFVVIGFYVALMNLLFLPFRCFQFSHTHVVLDEKEEIYRPLMIIYHFYDSINETVFSLFFCRLKFQNV